jgi:hypothetical protein
VVPTPLLQNKPDELAKKGTTELCHKRTERCHEDSFHLVHQRILPPAMEKINEDHNVIN